MSINKKVFWIFLSVFIVIFIMSSAILYYQQYTSSMHKILHNLIGFNEEVYKIRELQHQISDVKDPDVKDKLAEMTASLLKSSDELSKSVKGVLSLDIDTERISEDIINYNKAISDYIHDFELLKIKLDEIDTYYYKLHSFVHDYSPEKKELYSELGSIISAYSLKIDLDKYNEIKSLLDQISSGDDEAFRSVSDSMKVTLEQSYINHLQLLEKEEFLRLTSENFLERTYAISSSIESEERKMDGVVITAASVLCFTILLLTLVYWYLIKKYIKRFLKSHAEIMEAIKKGDTSADIKPFSSDELGELTVSMMRIGAELKEKDEELRISEEKYRSYINSSMLAVFVADMDKNLLEVNDGAEKLLGFNKEELLKMKVDELWVEEDESENIMKFKEVVKSGSLSTVIRLKTKSGDPVYLKLNSVKYADDRVIGFCLDISDQIRLENELKKLNENLLDKVEQELDKNLKQDQIIQQQKKLADMGRMVSAIAHQWRQPLNALALCVQEVMDEYLYSSLDEKYLQKFEENSMNLIAHMSDTIDDFREFFLPDITITRFNMLTELSSLVRLISVQIGSRNIEIELFCSCGKGTFRCSYNNDSIDCVNDQIFTEGYPGEFKQVIINLIYNSVDAIEERISKSGGEKGKIHLELKADEGLLSLKLKDNGSGISEEAFPHIFEPYYTTKEDGKGTGIGLYMSKTIIENHMKGRIYAENSKSGAVFVIEMPAAKSDDSIEKD